MKRRIGMANYELDLGGRGRKTRATVVHVNNIKLWHPGEVSIQRVVLAQDDALDDGPPSLKLVERELSPDHLFHIDNLKEKYRLKLPNTPGIADVPPNCINTESQMPSQNNPTVFLTNGRISYVVTLKNCLSWV